MNYTKISQGFNSGALVKSDELDNHIITSEKDYYYSLYNYTEEHVKKFASTRSLAGVRDVTTNKLWWDFDNKENPDKARLDALEVVSRLEQKGVPSADIEIYFSGGKGYHVLVTTESIHTRPQVEQYCIDMANGLDSFDTTMYDENQILRYPGTKHNVTGLYKVPLTKKQLFQPNSSHKKIAGDLGNITENFSWNVVPISLPPVAVKLVSPKTPMNTNVDPTKKPAQWRNCKWNIQQGNFKSGERHEALMVLAATVRGLNYDKDTAYYMCKASLKKQAEKTGTEEFPKEELYENIIESVYKPDWNGGAYTCQKPGWLQKYCQSLDTPCEKHSDTNVVKIEEAFGLFKNYAENIDGLTVKTGIPALDKKLRMTVGMSVGIVAPPGVGKTSIALQIINNMSKAGEQVLFLSYDMFHALVFQKLIQKHFNMQPDEIFNKFRAKDEAFQQKVMELIKKEYSNVHFCFKAGQTYPEILDTIKQVEENTGKKVKLMVCDYNELVHTDMSDGTSASNFVAQKMREIANVHQICVLSLFQPNKLSGSPADEITSYRAAKGGSGIEQSVSIMLGMSRPGYDPRKPENDKFMSINCLKNRMGALFSVDLGWDGLTGNLREMTSEEAGDLRRLREEKENKDAGDDWG